MPLETPDQIDIIARDESGKLTLIITDSGFTSDPVERFVLLTKKLMTYVGYVLDDGFQIEHPGLTPSDVKIKVLCATPPSDKMLQLDRLTNPGEESEWIEIEYEVFEGSMPFADRNDEDAVKRVAIKLPSFERYQLVNLVFWLCVGGLFLSGLHRTLVRGEAPWTPWLMAIGIWIFRKAKQRQRLNRINSELISSGIVSPKDRVQDRLDNS